MIEPLCGATELNNLGIGDTFVCQYGGNVGMVVWVNNARAVIDVYTGRQWHFTHPTKVLRVRGVLGVEVVE